jgi:hypothetical protein
VNLAIDNALEEAHVKARATLIAYLHHKIEVGDWHGVSDVANDLRVLEAEYAGRVSQSHP